MINAVETQSIPPIYKATSPLASLDATDASTEVAFRLSQIRMANTFHDFVRGHDYLAKITHKLDANHVIMHVNGHHIQMTFDQNLALGQQLQLRFMGSNPTPSFMLLNTFQLGVNDAQTQVSNTGQWVNQILHSDYPVHPQAKLNAISPMTQTPVTQPQRIAHDIQQTVSMSGLFYESHLAEFTQGQRSINSIMLEPQNALHHQHNAITVQQLHLLETNKFEWQGQVWQNQIMQFSIEKLPNNVNVTNQEHHHSAEEPPVAFESRLHLDLPKLGSISASLHLVQGQLRIHLNAEDANTLAMFCQDKASLIQAFEYTSQKLSTLSIESEHATHAR